MDRALPPLNAVRVFEAAARLSSFTAAAGELGMTQAAVSYQIKLLEDRLGIALFRRAARRVTLTPAGERLFRGAADAMSALRGAVAELTETADGVLAVTTLHTLATHWLVSRLGAFQLERPGIAVRLETSGQLMDLVRDGFDVAIRAGEGRWPGLQAHFLMANVYAPLCTPEFARERLDPDRPASVLEVPRIGVDEEWTAWLRAAGVPASGGEEPERSRFVAGAQSLEVTSAMSGRAIALGSPIFFAPELAAGRLVQPYDTVAEYSRAYWLVYPEERRRSPKIAAFRDWILAEAAADASAARYAPVALTASPAA